MNRNRSFLALFLVAACSLSIAVPEARAQAEHAHNGSLDEWFAVLEVPFLIGCIVFAFLTANALKGGIFGKGMQLLAWGFLVMAVGHLHMLIEAYTGLSLFEALLGATGGSIAWMLALVLTWGLSGAAFYQMYRASK